MDAAFPLTFAAVVGFTHAFEADHLIAVSTMVARRKTSLPDALKQGAYWGLGHTSTILLVGALMIAAKVAIQSHTFSYFEAGVGLMLVLLGAYRLRKTWLHERRHAQAHTPGTPPHHHRLAYGVGLVHGLAGSGALVLLVMTEIPNTLHAILYLLIFGVGSIAGMLLASGVFSLPFHQKLTTFGRLQIGLMLLSAFLSIGFGLRILWENLLHA